MLAFVWIQSQHCTPPEPHIYQSNPLTPLSITSEAVEPCDVTARFRHLPPGGAGEAGKRRQRYLEP